MGSPQNTAQLLNTPSLDSVNEDSITFGGTFNNNQSSTNPVASPVNEMNGYLNILERNIVSNDFGMNKDVSGINTKSRIDDENRKPKKLAPAILTPVAGQNSFTKTNGFNVPELSYSTMLSNRSVGRNPGFESNQFSMTPINRKINN